MIRRLFLAAALATVSLSGLRAEEADTSAPQLVQAGETEKLVGLAGKTVTVEGRARVGATAGGGITFFNMAPGAAGFKAVVFKSSAAAFPDGFDKYKDQTLRVTGKIELFKETTPEIVIKLPDQVEIVPGAPAGAEKPVE